MSSQFVGLFQRALNVPLSLIQLCDFSMRFPEDGKLTQESEQLLLKISPISLG